MNLCLVNTSRNASFQPLNLATLAGYVRARAKNRWDVSIVDAAVHRDVADAVVRRKPSVVGLTTLSSDIPFVLHVAAEVRRRLPGVMVVAGGIHATIRPQDLVCHGVDVAVIGEGELTLTELLDAFHAHAGRVDADWLSAIRGIACQGTSGHVMTTPERELIEDLDTVPHPARELLDNAVYHRRYFAQRGMNTNGVYTLHGSRGCPFRCYFCCVNVTVRGKVRLHSPGYIADEMQILADRYRAKWIFFTDDTFFVRKEHTRELCEEIVRRGLHRRLKWEVQLRSSLVRDGDEPLLRAMREAGCRQVDIGFESGNDRVLEMIKGKGITVEDHHRALLMLHTAGIEVLGTFIIANPTETFTEMMDTVNFIKAHRRELNRFQYGTVVPFPGTRVYQMAVETGVISDDYLSLLETDREAAFGSLLCTRSSTSEEVYRVKRELERLMLERITWREKAAWIAWNGLRKPAFTVRTVANAVRARLPW